MEEKRKKGLEDKRFVLPKIKAFAQQIDCNESVKIKQSYKDSFC